MNIYNKIKAASYEFTGQPPYMTSYCEFKGDLHIPLFKQAFADIDSQNNANIKKTNSDYPLAEQITDTQNHFIFLQTEENLITATEDFLCNQYAKTIEKSLSAPTIAILFQQSNTSNYLLILLFNHVYCDATSGKMFYLSLVKNYNQRLTNQTISPLNFEYLHDDEFSSRANNLTILNYLLLLPDLVKEMVIGLYLRSRLNKVEIIKPKNSPQTPIHKHYCIGKTDFTCFSDSNNSENKLSANSILTAAIAKAFIDVKGVETNYQANFFIPLDLRTKPTIHVYGNHIGGVYIAINKSMTLLQAAQSNSS